MVDENTDSRQTTRSAGSGAQGDPAPENPNIATIETLLTSNQKDGDLDDDLDLDPFDDLDDDELYEVAAYRRRVPILAIILFLISIAAVITGAVLISSNPGWQSDLNCFLTSDIKKCKLAPVELKRAQWRREEAATRPRYGDLTLCYYPQNAKVTIERIATKQMGWNGPMGEPTTTEIPNKSTELGEHEVIEQLPLRDLAIRERVQDEEGEITEVDHYSYRIRIEHEGYEPRERLIEPNDWKKPGPDVNYMVAWRCTVQGDAQGACCDLVPKPEFFKEPFAKLRRAIYCAEQYFDKKGERAGMTRADLEAQLKVLLVQHGFKTWDEFHRFETILTADTEWWTGVWEQIQSEECPEPQPATP